VKPKLFILHGVKYPRIPTFAESSVVREKFDVVGKGQVVEGNPDVVYCQSYLQCKRQLIRWGGPCVIPVGGILWNFKPHRAESIGRLLTQNRRRTPLFISEWLKREFIKRGLGHSQQSRVRHLTHGHWGMDHTINGVQPNRFRSKVDYSLGGSPIVVMSMTLSDEEWQWRKCRGMQIFMKAVKDVAKEYNARFVWAGQMKRSFSDTAEKWKREYGVAFIESHYKKDKVDRWPDILESASVFVHPSLYDGWGRVVADAMCAAVPTIVFDACALPTIGKTPLVVDPKSTGAIVGALRSLLASKDRRESLGRAHRKEALALTEAHRGDLAKILMEASKL